MHAFNPPPASVTGLGNSRSFLPGSTLHTGLPCYLIYIQVDGYHIVHILFANNGLAYILIGMGIY